MRNAYRIFVRRPEGKKPVGKPGHRWGDIIKMSLEETGCKGMN